MSSNNLRWFFRAFTFLIAMLFSHAAFASFHLWKLSQIYSNASGSVQYIQLETAAGGQQFLSGHNITATQGAVTHIFNFVKDLPGDTANKKFLIGTQGFANLGIVTPDYIVPDGFLFMPNGSVNFAGVDSINYNTLPSNGVDALNRSGATVPNSPANFAGASGTIPASTASNYQGLWWKASEPGWGMSVTQHANTIFAAFYTYDAAGQPVWYVISNCPVSGTSCSGDILMVAGGTAPTVPWNGAGKVVTTVGTGSLNFTDTSNGTLNFTINGVAGSKTITKQIFATGTTAPAVDYTDLWWSAAESGWGVSLTQQYNMIFAAWYAYDAAGKPVWYVASSCPVSGSGCTGELYKVSGGSSLTATWNGAGLVTTKVGTVVFAFTDASSGTMSYTLNGVNGQRAITRQVF